MPMDRITIFDTTLRDGEQAPGFSMNTGEKLELARQLDALGVDVIEAGFPIASEDDARAVKLIAQEIRRPVIAGLARCNPVDIECAGKALRPAARPRLHTFLATSDLHLECKLRMSREECLEAIGNGIRQARDYADDVQFSAEDATRSDMDFLCQVVETVIAAGATTVNLPDTVGYCVPEEIEAFYTEVLRRVGCADGVVYSAHCHDDLGLAAANTLAALKAGVRQVECTINGIGERAGNAALEEIVMAMAVRQDRLPYATGIDTTGLCRTSRLLAELTQEPVQANKAIVGRNAFAHEAGIHQHGMISDRRTYEIMTPEDVGAESTLVLGKHSGRHAVRRRCRRLGFELGPDEVDMVYREVVEMANRREPVTDKSIGAIIGRMKPAAATRCIGSTTLCTR